MKKEKLIQKWLADELSQQELEALKQLEEYEDYSKLSEAAKKFKAPSFDTEGNFLHLQEKLKSQETTSYSWKIFAKYAAVFAVLITSYFVFFHNPVTKIENLVEDKTKFVLPDSSVVYLNAVSILKYSAEDWKQERILFLKGEAFFKVETGNEFQVRTTAGTVTVIGTEFKVKQRKDFFEVSCFEGLVNVSTPDTTLNIAAGESFRAIEGDLEKTFISNKEPSWLNGWSSFNGEPYHQVIDEVERQYDVELNFKDFNPRKAGTFTGRFIHGDIEAALKSITFPYNLDFSIQEDEIIIVPSE